MAIRLTIKDSDTVRSGRPRPPVFVEGEDEEEVMDKWNAMGQWSSFDEVSFRKAIASISGTELPAGDDEILEAAVAHSGGNLELTVVDTVGSRIGRLVR